jgi:hypothetical protein
MDIDSDHYQQIVHLIHEKPFLPPIYPQITPKIFGTFSPVLKNISIPQAARKAGKARKDSKSGLGYFFRLL